MLCALVVAWYAFALVALPKLARLNNPVPLTPEKDGPSLVWAWVMSPVAIPILLAMAAGDLWAAIGRCLRPVFGFWLWATGADR